MALGDAGATRRGGGTTEVRGPGKGLSGDERLPCGRLVREVWERARDGGARPDTHAAGCPYCRQAVADLTALDTAVRALRSDRPSGHGVAERVMRAVRAEGRFGRLLPLDGADLSLRIAETAAAAVLRRAADGVPGVRAAGCRLLPRADGPRTDIALTLAASLDAPLTERADEVRRVVARTARRTIGFTPGRVDVRIVSVLEPGEGTAETGGPAGAEGQDGRYGRLPAPERRGWSGDEGGGGGSGDEGGSGGRSGGAT
ncbi:hypothetical protein [Streptomyces fuscigenes]|uniref:hypothetical protein n=1 Tax=Streptomyces fuscigenes TaxID=1528880 RepID=UPI001F33C865|nr:hypothetical protein [Streptomyces fuscigenes]MCF3961117.1 hypothetical protein [Streptomyces fuscigenes]